MTLPRSLLEQLSGNNLFSIIEDKEFGSFICKQPKNAISP